MHLDQGLNHIRDYNMLHYAKVMQALQSLQQELFEDYSHNIDLARASWQRLVADPLVVQKIASCVSPWLLPTWQGKLDAVYAADLLQEPYRVIGVDGSQVYPDRHQGSSCYLINIGALYVHYDITSSVQVESTPYVFTGRTQDEIALQAVDLVNAKRQELEFEHGLQWCTKFFDHTIPELFLFDGSLIFWHLASQENELQERYAKRYIYLMHQLYEQRILYAGYISLPKSKELVNLIRVELCNYMIAGCTEHALVDHLVDTVVGSFFLQPGQRTTMFKSNALMCNLYPAHLVPHFFYLHVGNEIVRIEVPAWIASDEQLSTLVARMIYDQTCKGGGYPVVLAEAHEQAVVKGPDRDFFYHMLQKLAIENKKQLIFSQKSSKKRIIGV